MPEPAERRRSGLFAATGDYLWFALSDGMDEHQHLYPKLDMRRKVGPPNHIH